MFDLTLREFDGEPRALDLDIATALGFERSRNIRKLIERHEDSLVEFGVMFRSTWSETPAEGGRPVDGYWLNEKQALFITAKSDTPNAARIVIDMVEVFSAWRNGRLGALPPRAPQIELHPDADVWRGLIREARMLFGKPAARELWRQSPLPDIEEQAAPENHDHPEEYAVMARFLSERCEVTGDRADWTQSGTLIAALMDWLDDRPHLGVWGPRQASLALRRASDCYSDPDTGARFSMKKRSINGYLGIRLRPLIEGGA